MIRSFLFLTLLLLGATDSLAQAIWVDQEDYAPLDMVTFGGNGFQGGEPVALVATGSKAGTVITHEVTASELGDFAGGFMLPDIFEPTYLLVATGMVSGAVAEVTFIDNFNLNNFSPALTTTLSCSGGNTTLSQTFTVGANAGNTQGEPIYWELDGTVLSPNTFMSGGSSSRTLTGIFESFVLRASSTSNFSSQGQRTRTWSVTVIGCSQPVTVSLSDLQHDYDGSAKQASVDTDPFGITTSVTYNGSTTPPTNAGTYAVVATVNQVGYAGTASGSLLIRKVAASVDVQGGSFEYDGLAHGAAGTATGVLGEPLGTLLNLGASFVNVPGGTANWTFAGNTNYEPANGQALIEITPASAAVDVVGGVFPYDGLPHAATVTTTPAGLSTSVLYAGSPSAPVNAGTYPVDAAVTNPNYEGAGAGAVEIEKVDQTISWATPADVVYGTALSAAQLNAIVTGVFGGSAPGALVYSPAAGTVLDAGSHTLQVDAAETQNYNAASQQVSLNVAQATQSITFAPLPARTYGDAPFTVIATSSAGLAVSFDAMGDCSVSGDLVTITGAGSCSITASQGGTLNHEAALDAVQSFDIATADALISVTGGTFVYDGLEHTATGSASGVGSEDLTGQLTIDPGFTDVPGGTVNWSFLGGANYNDASGFVSVSITPAPQIITFAPLSDRTYGDASFTVTAGGGGSTSDVTFAALGNCSVLIDEVTITGAGSCTITASQAADGNHFAAAPVDQAFAIDRASLTVTADDQEKTYDGNAFTGFTAAFLGFVNGEGEGDLGGTLTFGGSAAGAVGAGTFSIEPSGLTSDNYEIGFVPGTLTIERAQLTITATSPADVEYGAPAPAVTAEYDGFVGGESFSNLLSGPVCGTPYTAGDGVGPYGTSCEAAASDNYDLTYEAGSFNVSQRPIAVTADPQTRVYGDTDPTLSYQLTGGSLFGSDGFTGGLTREPGEDVGSYDILQGGLTAGANYELSFTGAALEITQRPIAVAADAGQGKTYGDPDPALSYQITSGNLVFSDDFVGALERGGDENVGIHPITQGTLTLGGNYDLTFTGADFEITRRAVEVTADPQTKVYGDDDPSLTYALSIGTLAFSDDFTGTLARNGGEDVGDYAIVQGTLALSDNYTLTYQGANLTITQRPITASADPKSKTYGDGDPALTYQVSAGSLAFSDDFTGALERVAGEDVGDYSIDQGTLDLSDNYLLSYVPALLSIGQRAIEVTADAGQTKVYGDSDPAAFTYAITDGNLVFSDAFSGALARAFGEDAGDYPIGQGSLALSTNYALSYVPADFTITPRPVTITPDAGQGKVYGEADPALAFTPSEALLAGNAFTGVLERVAGEDVGTYPIGLGSLAAGGNYQLSLDGGTVSFEITRRPVTVTADPQTKVYGETDPALTYLVTSGNTVFGDPFAGALTRTAGEDVGDWAILEGTLTLGSNYELSYIGADLSITQRPITVTADAQSKVYGDADPSLSYLITSGSLAFSDAFSGGLDRVSGEDVGLYGILQGTLDLSDNYLLSYFGADLEITQRPIAVTADPQTKVYGDDDPDLTYQITAGSLAFSDGFTGALTRDLGETVLGGPYAITQGSLSLTPNYDLSFFGAALEITTKAASVTPDANTKVYGADDPDLTGTLDGFLSGDAVTALYARAAGESVDGGPYTISATLDPAGVLTNYDVTYNTAEFTITPATLSVDADPQTKVYGEDDPALSYDVDGLQFSDTEGSVLSGGLTRAAGENVGSRAITQGSLVSNTNYTISFTGNALEITQRPVTITADAKSKTYGDGDPSLTHQITSGSTAFDDDFSGALTRVAGEDVGSYEIQQGSVTLGPNYALSYVGANLIVGQRPVTVTADAKTKVYGEGDPGLTYQVTSGSLAFSDAFTGALNRAPGENVGSYAIQQNTLALSANYALTYQGANLAITQRPITVTADPKTKLVGASDPALTYQVTSGNLVGTDAFAGGLVRVPGESVGHYAIQQGSLTAGGNYALTYAGADFWITYGTPSQFLSPMSGIPGVAIRAQRNRTVPVKFELPSLPGYAGAIAHISLLYITGGTATAVTVELGTGPSDGGTLFRYTGGQYMYNLGTRNLTPGLYRVVATLADGQPPIEGLIEVTR